MRKDKSERGLGPFTGRQLTVMICVIAVVALFPVGLWAATTATKAAAVVTDPGGVNQATVSANGELSVKGSVTGSVTATNASPQDLYVNNTIPALTNTTPNRDGTLVAQAPTGKALVITEIGFDTSFGEGNEAGILFFRAPANTSCHFNAFGADEVGGATPATSGFTSIPMPSGVVVPNGDVLCAQKSDGLAVVVWVYGYLVPAASAP